MVISVHHRFGVLSAQPLIAIGGVVPMIAFGLVCLIAAMVALTLPETLGRPMWDTILETLAAEATSKQSYIAISQLQVSEAPICIQMVNAIDDDDSVVDERPNNL